MTKTPIILCGALGRMGRACVELVLSSMPDFAIKAAIARDNTQEKPAHWPCEISQSISASLGPAVIVDFSHHSQLLKHLEHACKNKWPILIATTGHSEENLEALREASQHIPVVYAPNTSVMANLLIQFCAHAARIKDVCAHIVEVHHRDKKDTPSGTALAIGRAMMPYIDDPEKITGSSLRMANVVGEHTVSFFKENERLDLSHRVSDRRIFAEGALIAAQFLYGQHPGLYDMGDVLNLK
jgi:4-hydroxy-tetrahydrodipicolinate reductase